MLRKEAGAYPVNKEDGILYPFVTDFAAGRNELPAIEVGKNDYIRLFLRMARSMDNGMSSFIDREIEHTATTMNASVCNS